MRNLILKALLCLSELSFEDETQIQYCYQQVNLQPSYLQIHNKGVRLVYFTTKAFICDIFV